jgi:hypothetical protein
VEDGELLLCCVVGEAEFLCCVVRLCCVVEDGELRLCCVVGEAEFLCCVVRLCCVVLLVKQNFC